MRRVLKNSPNSENHLYYHFTCSRMPLKGRLSGGREVLGNARFAAGSVRIN